MNRKVAIPMYDAVKFPIPKCTMFGWHIKDRILQEISLFPVPVSDIWLPTPKYSPQIKVRVVDKHPTPGQWVLNPDWSYSQGQGCRKASHPASHYTKV